jgi:hypothetical protein
MGAAAEQRCCELRGRRAMKPTPRVLKGALFCEDGFCVLAINLV